jgi:hypothetical protein
MNKAEVIVELGTTGIGLDPTSASLKGMVVALGKLGSADRRRLIDQTDKLLERDAKKLERNRIAAARLLTASLPDSLPVIQKWLGIDSGTGRHEVQFSLLCFLSDAQLLELTNSQERKIFQLIANFLLSVRTNLGKAAWMAGDLLGDHWKGPGALVALVEALHHARFAAGRRAALHGLERRFCSSGPKDRQVILATLASAAEVDKNPTIRHLAIRLSKRLTATSKRI